MIYLLRKTLESISDNGVRYTATQVGLRLLAPFAAVVFALYDRATTDRARDVTIAVRGRTPESDTFALLDQCAERDGEPTLHVCSTRDVDDTQFDLWDSRGVTVVSSRFHALECIRSISRSSVVVCKQDSHFKWYRLFDSSDRTWIRLYHGPITKSYERTRTGSRPQRIEPVTSIVQDGIGHRSVNSDAEKYFRSSSEGRHPGRFPTWGYPRFDRIRRFVDGESEPILPTQTERVVDEPETVNILYAPTHKDGAYETTFFPFPDFEIRRLREFCAEHDVRFFLRPHPGNEDQYTHLTDGEHVVFAGQQFANSATELMPYMDGLVTDYSSIYVEFLPFDRPIIFVKDDHERFQQVRGLAFEYDRYFPGPKPDTFQQFLETLEGVGEDGDLDSTYAENRAFVRETFAPDHDRSFLTEVLDES
jgi:hypothetical protein